MGKRKRTNDVEEIMLAVQRIGAAVASLGVSIEQMASQIKDQENRVVISRDILTHRCKLIEESIATLNDKVSPLHRQFNERLRRIRQRRKQRQARRDADRQRVIDKAKKLIERSHANPNGMSVLGFHVHPDATMDMSIATQHIQKQLAERIESIIASEIAIRRSDQ